MFFHIDIDPRYGVGGGFRTPKITKKNTQQITKIKLVRKMFTLLGRVSKSVINYL